MRRNGEERLLSLEESSKEESEKELLLKLIITFLFQYASSLPSFKEGSRSLKNRKDKNRENI